MKQKFPYDKYFNDENFVSEYEAYQKRHGERTRESDKVIVDLVKRTTANSRSSPCKLLDIGCSTGNLLYHIRQSIPDFDLHGGDISRAAIEACRKNPGLAGIEFEEMDVFGLEPEDGYDVVIANAVLVYFLWEQYRQAIKSIYRALAPGGVYIAFEWIHLFEHQDIVLHETNLSRPEGIRYCIRPLNKVVQVMNEVGFIDVEGRPFEMPIDLPQPGYDEEVVSFTMKSDAGNRLTFRGAFYQPWCHVVAHKGID